MNLVIKIITLFFIICKKLREFQIYPVLYDNWLFLTLFLFSPKKKREEEMGNEVAKQVLNHFLISG